MHDDSVAVARSFERAKTRREHRDTARFDEETRRHGNREERADGEKDHCQFLRGSRF